MVRPMYLPAALHGIEASLIASGSLRKLRSFMLGVVWSRRQLLANVGAVLSLQTGPLVATLLSVLFGSGLGYCVGIFLFGLRRLVGSIASWRWLVGVALGMVLSIFSLLVLLRLVSGGILLLGLGLVYLCLVTWLALFSILRLAILDAWRNKVAAALCGRAGFRGDSGLFGAP